MKKKKARRQAEKHIYIHNDLANAAYHFKKRIEERHVNNDMKGISFDVLAGNILLAFSIEAKINFLGVQLIKDWKEKEKQRRS